jgi:hypothetical protein
MIFVFNFRAYARFRPPQHEVLPIGSEISTRPVMDCASNRCMAEPASQRRTAVHRIVNH